MFSFGRYNGYKYTFFNRYVEAGLLDRLIGLLYLMRKEVAVLDAEADEEKDHGGIQYEPGDTSSGASLGGRQGEGKPRPYILLNGLLGQS